MKGQGHQISLPTRLKRLTTQVAVREGFMEEVIPGSEERRYFRLREQQVQRQGLSWVSSRERQNH